MAARIFTRSVGGFTVGEIRDLDWDSVHASMVQFHGVEDPPDSYSIDIEEAARRYVAGLQPARESKTALRRAG